MNLSPLSIELGRASNQCSVYCSSYCREAACSDDLGRVWTPAHQTIKTEALDVRNSSLWFPEMTLFFRYRYKLV
jgi:hypothetical protein